MEGSEKRREREEPKLDVDLELELLGLLPGVVWVTEVTV